MESVKINGKEYFTATGVASDVGICRQTLWRWRQSGKIPPGYRHRSGQVLFTEDEVQIICAYATRVVPIETVAASDRGKGSELGVATK